MKRNITALLLSALLLASSGLHGKSGNESKEIAEALFSDQVYMESKLSPDGLHLASLAYYKQKPSLYILNLETKVYSVVTVNDGEDIGPFFWVDDEHVVYNIDKWEMYSMGLNVHSIKSNRSRKILNPWETKLYFAGMVDPLVHIRGKFAFKASADGPADLYMINLETDALTKMADNTGQITDYVVNRDGEPVIAIESRDGESVMLKRNGKDGWEETGNSLGSAKPLGVLPGDKFLLVETANDKGYRGINLFNLETGSYSGKARYLDGYDLCKFPLYDNLSGKVIGVRVETDKPGNFWFDSAVRKVEEVIKARFSNYKLDYLGYNTAAKISYFMASNDTMPPVIIQIEDGSTTPTLIYQQMPKTFALQFQEMEPFLFESQDGAAEIHGYLTKPEGEGPYPTVVLVHGGPGERDSWGFDPAVQFFALNGYAVLQINYRGSTGYGYGYQLNRFSDIALLSVDDVTEGVRQAIDRGIVDPDRIAIVGEGFGGYIATSAAAKSPDIWKAVVSYASPYDLNELKKQDDKKNVEWISARYGDHNEDLYAKLSPVHHADMFEASVLLVHGKEDKRVSDTQAKDMRNALEKAGKEVEASFMNWGVHGLPVHEDRIEFYQEVLSFLEQHM